MLFILENFRHHKSSTNSPVSPPVQGFSLPLAISVFSTFPLTFFFPSLDYFETNPQILYQLTKIMKIISIMIFLP